MKKIIPLLFIAVFLNLIFISLCPANQPDNGASSQINFSSAEPLDCLALQVEKIKEPYLRCTMLIDIAGAYIELGFSDKSEYLLRKALGLAQNTENQLVKSVLIFNIIDKFISLNKDTLALELAKYIDLLDVRQDILVKIVSNYLQQNQYEQALELTRKIDEPTFRALALCKIIDRLATQKLFEELAKIQKIVQLQPLSVQRVIRLILREENKKSEEAPIPNLFASKSPSKKTKALIILAKNKIALGAPEAAGYILDEAALLSENIKGEYVKNECLTQIGLCYAQTGQLEKAQKIASTIKIPFSRAELLARIATCYSEKKEFDTAIKVIADINVQCLREKALAATVILCLEQGQEKFSSEIIGKIKSTAERSRIYAAIIKNYLQNKLYDQALQISKAIDDPETKMLALTAIAKELEKNKQFSGQLREAFLESLALLK